MSGRIRSLKPEWLEDDPLCSCSDAARVLSAGLLLLADDHGNGRGSERYLGSQVFRGQALNKVRAALRELVKIRYVRIYTVDEQEYFSVRNWAKHQRVNHPSAPRVPPPSEVLCKSQETLCNPQEVLSPDPDPDPDPDPEEEHSRGKGEERQKIRDPLAVRVFIEDFNNASKKMGGAPATNFGLDPWRANLVVESCRSAGLKHKAILFSWFEPRARPTYTLEALEKATPLLIEEIRRQSAAAAP